MVEGIPEKAPRRDAALVILYVAMFLVVAGVGIITPLFPFFAKEMGASAFDLGLMIAVFSMAQVIAGPLWGRLSDRIGRKPVLIAGLVGYALSYFFLIWAANLPGLLLARVFGGLLSASAFPSAQAYVVDLTQTENRAYGMANMSAASNLGFLLGPAMGSLFSFFGLRAAFAIGGAIILGTAILCAILLPTAARRLPGVAQNQRQDWHEIGSAILGRNSLLLWVTMLTSFGNITMYSILGYFMIQKFGAQTSDTAIVYTLMGSVSVLLQIFVVGKVLRRMAEDILVILSLLLAVVGFIGLAYAPSLLVLYIWVVVIGASMALSRPAIVIAISRRTRLGQGLTMGLQGSFDNFGRVIGPLWAGMAFGFSLAAPYWSSVVAYLLAIGFQFTAYRVFLGTASLRR